MESSWFEDAINTSLHTLTTSARFLLEGERDTPRMNLCPDVGELPTEVVTWSSANDPDLYPLPHFTFLIPTSPSSNSSHPSSLPLDLQPQRNPLRVRPHANMTQQDFPAVLYRVFLLLLWCCGGDGVNFCTGVEAGGM